MRKLFNGSLYVRNLSGLALVASASVLIGACATDGSGGLPGGVGGPEGPGNSTEQPGSAYDRPGSSGTERPTSSGSERPASNCTATYGDLLDVFVGLCEVVKECGFVGSEPGPDPEDTENQEYVHGKYTARMALDRVVSVLPLTRTRGNEQGSDDDFFDSCEAVADCRTGGCGIDLNQTVIDDDSGICIGTALNCIRAIFAMISCDGDMSSLEESNAPAACQELIDASSGSSIDEGSID